MALAAAAGGAPVVVCSSPSDYQGQLQQQAAGAAVESPLHRRSANYQPSTWDYDSIICSPSVPQQLQATLLLVNKEKDRVRRLLNRLQQEAGGDARSRSRLVRTIHQLQSLGVAYHFEEEIRGILLAMHRSNSHDDLDLHSSALLFGMLRGQGIPASTDMLMSAAFREADNKKLDSDGLLALYQASFLAFPGETVLEEARAFAVDNLAGLSAGSHLQLLPSHWRPPRLQAMWSLQTLARENGTTGVADDDPAATIVLQLAQADFNLVQALHRAELAEVTRWWRQSGLGEGLLPFARDRVVECFFCAACIAPEPSMADCRAVLAKAGSLIVHLDDVYDVYGKPGELRAFTDAIGSWPDHDDGVVVALCYRSTATMA